MSDTLGRPEISADETTRRTILRKDWVPCKAAFIDWSSRRRAMPVW